MNYEDYMRPIKLGQDLYALWSDKKWAEAAQFIEQHPETCRTMGWTSIACYGRRGMPMWAHFGALLRDGRHTDSEKVKDHARKVARTTASFDEEPDKSYASLLMNYALNAKWSDVLKECIALGIDIKEKPLFTASEDLKGEMKTIWDNWTCTAEAKVEVEAEAEAVVCCICLDQEPNSVYYPCAHTEMCFDCARDLQTCPLCRTEGYCKKNL